MEEWDLDTGEPRVTAADRSELPEVLRFWRLAAHGESISDDLESLERLWSRDPDALLLVRRRGELVGTVIAGYDGWRCHLYRLAVHPEYRRQGLARLLLRAAESRFVTLGGRRGDAMVLADNHQARAAWTAAGYAPQPQWNRWVRFLDE
ncbi:GNAT family N-acetyltransferase [Streptomyces sp. NPDC005438]|uniref:GNAT family N-acetyltransferase n=1 Tax=Streptomyces sp. NPDC005438 TaxID=3156880 RepID=UPI0033A68AA5